MADSTWVPLYMKDDPRLPISITVLSPTGQQSSLTGEDDPDLTRPEEYTFYRGKITSVHPADAEVISGRVHFKQGLPIMVFGDPGDKMHKGPESIAERTTKLEAQLAMFLEQAQAQGIVLEDGGDDDGPRVPDRVNCPTCNTVNARGTSTCSACGKSL